MEPDPIRRAFEAWWTENTGKRLRNQQMLKDEAYGVYRDAMREAAREAVKVVGSIPCDTVEIDSIQGTLEAIRKHFGVEGEAP